MSPDNLKIVPERDEPAPVRSSVSKGGAGIGVVSVLFLLSLGVGAGVAYQNVQLSGKLDYLQGQFESQYQLNQKQQEELNAAKQTLGLLENELVATGRTLSKSGSTLEKRLNESEHEIRKLWDLSSKRNRADITSANTSIKSLQGQQGVLSADIDKLRQQVAALSKVKKELEQLISKGEQGLSQRIGLQQLELSAQKSDLERLEQLSEQFAASLAELKGTVAGIEKDSGVTDKLAVYDERLDAIDASRRQLTSNVTRLNTDVNTLQLKLNALTPADAPKSSAATPVTAQ